MMTLNEFRSYFKRRIDRAGGVRRLAQQLGVSSAYVSDVRHGRRDPGPSILRPLGLRMEREVLKMVSRGK